MAISDNQSIPPTDQPTGDLEHLFRQKFAEAEVAPRASLWEQLDHNLLEAQNQTYRRRLAAYRWAAAASVLLFLGLGSWLGLHYGSDEHQLAELAAHAVVAPESAGTAPAGRAAAARSAAAAAATGQNPAAAGAALVAAGAAPTSAGATADFRRPAAGGFFRSSAAAASAAGALAATPAGAGAAGFASAGAAGYSAAGAPGLGGSVASAAQPAGMEAGAGAGGQLATTGGNAGSGAVTAAAYPELDALLANRPGLAGGLRFARPVRLSEVPMAQASLVTPAPTPEEEPAPAPRPRRWRLQGSTATSAYHPNMNFAQSDGLASRNAKPTATTYASGSNSTYAAAAAEYRGNLQAGLSQRAGLAASFAVNKRWTLLAGAEVAENNASSRTTYGFLDGKNPNSDISRPNVDPNVQPTPQSPLRRTTYRYRTASLPVAVRYGSAKPGVSIYAKAGAVMSVLLSSRSELEGVPEATRTYNVASADSPYRLVQLAARGGLGARFQPANAAWSLAVGPTTELGLNTLNTSPTQDPLHRSRPYSVGMEASVEFGGRTALAP